MDAISKRVKFLHIGSVNTKTDYNNAYGSASSVFTLIKVLELTINKHNAQIKNKTTGKAHRLMDAHILLANL